MKKISTEVVEISFEIPISAFVIIDYSHHLLRGVSSCLRQDALCMDFNSTVAPQIRKISRS